MISALSHPQPLNGNKLLQIRSLILLFLISLCSILSAQEKPAFDTTTVEINGKHFYRHLIVPGNTLYSISRQYGLPVQTIEEYNPASKKGLSVGDTLYILAAEKDKDFIEQKMEVDGNIIVHEVQKKQTLYAISKIYGISVGDIMAENPELKKGLKEGQFIRIPISKLKKEEEKKQIDENRFIRHEVGEKETLYALSKLYNVPIDSIVTSNDGLKEGLKVGQVIVIPRRAMAATLPVDSGIMKDVYKVAFVMPFFLDLNDTLLTKLKIDEEERVLSKSIVSIQFYQGCLMALDSLRKSGKKFEVSFYDTGKDSTRIDEMMKDGSFADLDLIIGPFYLSSFMRMADFAQKNSIHIVSPVPQNNRILLGNSYVSKVATSRNIIFKNLGRYVANLYRTENVIMVDKLFRANPLLLAFKNEFLNTLEKSGDTSSIKNLKKVNWNSGKIDEIKGLLQDSGINVIIVPSDDQVYVTELLANLNSIHEDYHIRVVGEDRWLRYTNIDFSYYDNLNVMIPTDGFIDYSNPFTKSFIRRFHRRFEVFPERFAFQGFDITYYYLNMLWNNGTRIERAMMRELDRLFYFKFHYFKTGMESGYENSSTFLLEFRQLELHEVPVYD